MKNQSMTRRNGMRAAAGLLVAGGLLVAARGQTEWQDLLKYDFGTCEAALTNIEQQVLLAAPGQRAALEDKLLGVLGAGEATFPAKQYACRMLKTIGSEKSVPALAKLLKDEKLSHAARYALEALPGDKAGNALCAALKTTSGKLRIGIIGSLGARGNDKAVKPLAALLGDKDAPTATAALKALARIGSPVAADALEQAKVADALNAEWCHAALACAEKLIKTGDAKRALQLIQQALKNEQCPAGVRMGAFITLVSLHKEGGAKLILNALESDDAVLQKAIVPAVAQLAGADSLQVLVKALPDLAVEKQVQLLNALVAHKDTPNMSAQLTKMLAGQNAELKTAAVTAVVRLGDAQNVTPLLALLEANDDLAKLAQQTLIDLQGKNVVKELTKAAKTGDPKLRVTVIGILAERRDAKVLPALYALTDDANAKVRHAATKAISALGGAGDVAKLVELLLTKKDSGDRDSFASATSAIAAREADVNTRAAAVIAGLAKADDEAKVLLLGVLSALGGKPACEAVRGCLKSTTPDVKKAAVKALAEWPDAMPLDDLKNVVKGDANEINRILAMRGYIRLLADAHMKPEKRVAAYKEMFALAARPEEKRAVFAGLADSPSLPVLQFLEGHLNDAGVKAEALTAYEKIAEELIKPKSKEAKAALQRVIAATDDKNLRKRAENALKKIK